MRCNKVLYFDIIAIWDYMCVWTSWAHIYEHLVLFCKIGCDRQELEACDALLPPLSPEEEHDLIGRVRSLMVHVP